MAQLTKKEMDILDKLNKAVMASDGIAALAFLTHQIHNPPLGLNFDYAECNWFELEDLLTPQESLFHFQGCINDNSKSKDPRVKRYLDFCQSQLSILNFFLDVYEFGELKGRCVYDFVHTLSDESLKKIALQYYRERTWRMNAGTPEWLCKLVKDLLNVQEGESVVDLCSGRGEFLSQFSGNNHYGFEINADVIDYAIGLCALNGSFPLFEQHDVLTLNGSKFDKCFSEYPWGYRFERPIQILESDKWNPLPVKDIKRSMTSWLFIAKALSLTNESGMTIIHANEGALYSTYESDIRKEAIEKGLLKAVISLPASIMEDTQIRTSLLVFSRGNSAVRFIDASNKGIPNKLRRNILSEEDIRWILGEIDNEETSESAITVSNEAIIAHDSILLSSHYLHPETKRIVMTNGKKIADLGTIIVRGVVMNSSYLVKRAVSQYRVLSSSDIVDGRIDVPSLPYLTPEGLQTLSKKALGNVLQDGDVVMTNKSTVIKTAVVETNGEKILLFGSLCGLRIDTSVMNPDYLCAFFNSAVGQDLLKTIQTGTVISMITVANLNEFVVPCPPIAEQNRFATDIALTLEMIQDAKDRIAKLQKSVSGSFDFLIEENE